MTFVAIGALRDKHNIYAESKIRECLYFSRNLVLHFRRNGSRFREQRYTVSSPVCPTGVTHVLLHVKVIPDIDLDSISFMC